MNIFPQHHFVSFEMENKKREGTKEPLFDFKKKQIVIKDGKVVYCNREEALKQWITLLIYTEVDKYNVYKNTQFGLVNLYALRGHQYGTSEFGLSEMKRELKEKIMKKSGVKEVKNIEILSTFNALNIKLTVVTEWNEEIVNEVNI